MSNLFGRRAAILSCRLGMADGVSVTATQWARALRRLGVRVRTVAGGGRPDVLIRSLALDSRRPPAQRELAAALDDVDVVVADNICSLPMNRPVGEAVARYLRGRPAVLRHHDLPWERAQYASLTTWPPDDPSWRHVTINELARPSLEARRAIVATTIYHGFDERPCPEQRDAVRRRLKIGDEPLVLQPTRAIPRKGIDIGLALTAAVGGTYWLTGPAEDGYQDELAEVLGSGGVPIRRRLPFGVQMAGAYAACDAVVLPLIESALHRKPIAVGAPGGAGAGVVRVPVVRRRRSRAAHGLPRPPPIRTSSTTTRPSPAPTSASTRWPAGWRCCWRVPRCAPTPGVARCPCASA